MPHRTAANSASSCAPRDRAPLPDLRRLSRDELRAYTLEGWRDTEWLFSSIVRESAFYESPDPLRRPLIFYLGHTAAFFVNKLRAAGLVAPGRGVDPELDQLLAVGVDPARASELNDGSLWPTLARVQRYRSEAWERVEEALEHIPLELPITDASPAWALLMAAEHERIHFETSSVLIRQSAVRNLARPEAFQDADTHFERERGGWVSVPRGITQLGKPKSSPTFGWDNEYGALEVDVPGFEVMKDLVTNADYRAFIDAGGYEREELWSTAGWAWRVQHDVKAPRFWRPGETLRYRGMFEERAMPWRWPVEVNAFEANAYARFVRGAEDCAVSLPSEAQWSRMLDLVPSSRQDAAGWSHQLQLRSGSPAPVGYADAGKGRAIHDVRGNVWQWLSDDFYPLPGFKPHRLYEDFSKPYFDPEHAMLRGGSWATTGAGATHEYRLWFRREFYQHAGFRLVRPRR